MARMENLYHPEREALVTLVLVDLEILALADRAIHLEDLVGLVIPLADLVVLVILVLVAQVA